MRNDEPNNPNSQDAEATMACEHALELVPSFVDGEASESLASAVRKHLIDCADCRVVVQEQKSLRQWFEPVAGEAGRGDVEIPEGFAARVTAMAFAGSTGSGPTASSLSGAGSSSTGFGSHLAGAESAHAGSQSGSQQRRGPRLLRSLDAGSSRVDSSAEGNSLGFVIGLTAMAAALMVSFTLMLAQDKRYDVGDAPLSADAPLEETLRNLEALNKAQLVALEAASSESGKLDPADERAADTSHNGEEDEGSPKGSK